MGCRRGKRVCWPSGNFANGERSDELAFGGASDSGDFSWVWDLEFLEWSCAAGPDDAGGIDAGFDAGVLAERFSHGLIHQPRPCGVREELEVARSVAAQDLFGLF